MTRGGEKPPVWGPVGMILFLKKADQIHGCDDPFRF